MNIAIIPARGGSKRILRKNIRNFCGKPLIAYPILACLQSGLFSHVLVSTDDEEIAKIARRYGAEVPFLRPAELSGDFVATSPVVEHALAWAQTHWGECENYCQLYANPFITAENIIRGFSLLQEDQAHEVLAIAEYPYPVLRSFVFEQGKLVYAFPEYKTSRSQDLPVYYHDAAQFYWHKNSCVVNDEEKKVTSIILPRHMVVDIDTEEDWHIAEKLYIAFLQDTKD